MQRAGRQRCRREWTRARASTSLGEAVARKRRGDEWGGRTTSGNKASAAERTCDKNGHCRYPCECQHGGDGDGLFIQGERVPVRTSNSCWGDGLHSSTRTGGDLSLSAEPPAEAPEDAPPAVAEMARNADRLLRFIGGERQTGAPRSTIAADINGIL